MGGHFYYFEDQEDRGLPNIKVLGQYAFSGHSAAEGRQIAAAGKSQNAANISIWRLLGDLAHQYQVFWSKMPPMNLDKKGH